jgi:23S rRNA pseudouridine2605 synthase
MARERLQKLLAAAGLASRRHAEAWLRAGRVSVNGAPARLGDSADLEHDDVRVDGAPIAREPVVWWALHKPRGVLSTARDPEGRRTVLDLVPEANARVFPVGRLDADSEGLVLLTNDGDGAQALLHPSLGSEREYRVRARGRMSADAVARLERGVLLDDGPTAPARVARIRFDARTGLCELALILREGRKRQIRRALGALGHPVQDLVRVRMGPIRLGSLRAGEARRLSSRERAALARHVATLRARPARETDAQAMRRKPRKSPGRREESSRRRAPAQVPRDD